MKKVLIAVDETKSSRAVLTTFHNSVQEPEEVVLMHVERLEGHSLMIDMLGEAELSTLKESVSGTEHKEALDRKASDILGYYARQLQDSGTFRIKTVVREGIPAEEILKVADEEGVELIILGRSERKGIDKIVAGNMGKEVAKGARVPVLMARMPSICEAPYTWRDALAAVSVTSAVVLCLFILGLILR